MSSEMTSPDEPILNVSDLTVSYNVDGEMVTAIDGISFRVDRGESVALVGESGSGKSTAAMSVISVLPQGTEIGGSIRYRGKEIVGLSSRAMNRIRGREIAAIFQEPMTALNPVLTVGYQIMEPLRLHRRMTPSQAKAQTLELLDMVDMPDPIKAFSSYPHQLSGGQRQRAMIAEALSCEPKLLIADEPTTALDVTVQAEILDLMHRLRSEFHSAILLITHDMGVVADLADYVAVMRDGKIVETGDVRRVLREPEAEYTARLLEAVPRLECAVPDAAPASTEEPQAEPVMDFRDVSVEFERGGKLGPFRAVDEVSMQIRPGEVVGLVGESGSGKSTLSRVAVGLQRISGGSATVGGVDLTDLTRANRVKLSKTVGIVFQDPSSSLNPRLPIGESIAEPMFRAKIGPSRQIWQRVAELIDAVQLPGNFINRFPHELSGGQKQRIGIARALALRPSLLVADEPTSALDVSVQAVVLDLLRELRQELSFACLFVSHDLAVVEDFTDRIVVMRHGVFVEQGLKGQVLGAPREHYTRELIASVPYPDPDIQRARREQRRARRDAAAVHDAVATEK